MLTIDTILNAVHRHRPMSRRHLERLIKTLEIEPLGARQRPQRYPDDAAKRIIEHLGLAEPENGCGRKGCPSNGRALTMPELRRERSKARRGQ